RGEGDRHFAADQRKELRRGALIRYVEQVDPGHALEHLRGEVRLRAAARGAVLQRAGLALGERDQLLRGRGGPPRVDDQQRRQVDEVGDEGEVPKRVERQARIDRRIDGVRADRVDEQRVRVAFLLRDELAGDVAGGARAVLRDDLLSPFLGELLRERPRQDVRGAARRKGDDDAHGARREGLRPRGAVQPQDREQRTAGEGTHPGFV